MAGTISLQGLAKSLGGEISGRDRVLCPGPGHRPLDRSLSVWLTDTGSFTVHSFAGDDLEYCRLHVASLTGLPTHGDRHEHSDEERAAWGRKKAEAEGKKLDEAEHKLAAAKRILVESMPPTPETPTGLYLVRRGIDPPWPDCIRHHPRLKHTDAAGRVSFHPAMVCPIRDIRTDALVGVHRTWLAPDGMKADVDKPKKVLGKLFGGAIKLTPDEDVEIGLGVAEGIETGLSVLAEGWSPVWALMTAGNLAALPVLPGIEALTIFGDNDDHKSGAGERTARDCAARWRDEGREATIFVPQAAGVDWNDELGHR